MEKKPAPKNKHEDERESERERISYNVHVKWMRRLKWVQQKSVLISVHCVAWPSCLHGSTFISWIEREKKTKSVQTFTWMKTDLAPFDTCNSYWVKWSKLTKIMCKTCWCQTCTFFGISYLLLKDSSKCHSKNFAEILLHKKNQFNVKIKKTHNKLRKQWWNCTYLKLESSFTRCIFYVLNICSEEKFRFEWKQTTAAGWTIS